MIGCSFARSSDRFVAVRSSRSSVRRASRPDNLASGVHLGTHLPHDPSRAATPSTSSLSAGSRSSSSPDLLHAELFARPPPAAAAAQLADFPPTYTVLLPAARPAADSLPHLVDLQQMPHAAPPLSMLLRRLSSHPSHSSAFHAMLLKSSSLSSPIPATALLAAYAKAGLLCAAYSLFDKMPARDAVAWNAPIACHVRHAHPSTATKAFPGMAAAGFASTAATLCIMLKACTSFCVIRHDRQVHELTILLCHGDVIMKIALVIST